MDNKRALDFKSESSGVNVRLVIIVAILLCLIAGFSQILLGNPIAAVFALAVTAPMATVLLLQRNRKAILDSGSESARDTDSTGGK